MRIMPNILIRNLPDDVVATLKARAAKNHRSLQKELEHILVALAEASPREPLPSVASELKMSEAKDFGAWRREDVYSDDGR